MDPVLRLYEGCPVMISTNIDVKNHKANGTRATVENIVLNNGENFDDVIYCGRTMKATTASKINYVELRYETVPNTGVETFKVEPKEFFYSTNLRFPEMLSMETSDRATVRMKAQQLPFLSNSATTGHKLQGSTLKSLFVHCWRYERNWPYVVLSRVRTLAGLFLRLPLSSDPKKYSVPSGYTKMIQTMRSRGPTYWSTNEYRRRFFNN